MLAPGALGRCDPYHVLFYGLGTVLLAFIYLSGRGTKTAFRTYTVVYLLIFFVGLEMINVWVFRLTPGIVRSWVVDTWRGRRATTEADLTPLLKFDQLALAYGSYGYNKPTQRWLWSHKKIAPEYYMGGMGIYTQSQMAERILDLGRFRHVLIHESYQNIHEQAIHEPCAADEYYLRKALLYPWRLTCVRFALDPDGQISRYLQTDYHVIETVGEYLVLEKNLTADSSPRAPSR
jgi:hypothetical protein